MISESPNNSLRGGNVYIIIVAAGKGTRFGASMPKQYLDLQGRPVLMHTIEAFRKALPKSRIVTVISAEMNDFWLELCEKHGFEPGKIVFGGATRTQSAINALQSIENEVDKGRDVIMIHDGARPIVSHELVYRIANEVDRADKSAVLPSLPMTDSMCLLVGEALQPEDRSKYVRVQTPQAFHADILFETYHKAIAEGCTDLSDDASAVARFTGTALNHVAGDANNIKITNPLDIKIAEILLANALSPAL